MKLKSVCLAIAMSLPLVFASNANATQTNYGKITLIKSTTVQAYIYVEGLNDPFGCGNNTFVRFYWGTTESNKLWSMILAAQMSGKQVSFEGTCVSGFLAANAVYVSS